MGFFAQWISRAPGLFCRIFPSLVGRFFYGGKSHPKKTVIAAFIAARIANDISPKSGADDFYFTVMYLLIPWPEHLP